MHPSRLVLTTLHCVHDRQFREGIRQRVLAPLLAYRLHRYERWAEGVKAKFTLSPQATFLPPTTMPALDASTSVSSTTNLAEIKQLTNCFVWRSASAASQGRLIRCVGDECRTPLPP